ncbi:hypothetical protein OBBRIDRAFT_891022 [Obba rivulosa]|uniref:F-box domain-containing protein n=1 Tax=Obba rivulosa TaxID=1052685 RepID=A0A8E2DKD4_9APHY|nr:hypothetical protein OBBRIDRAFT_891022 [Obba rivulosa]
MVVGQAGIPGVGECDEPGVILGLGSSSQDFEEHITRLNSASLRTASRALETSLVAVRARLNYSCHINQLPPETLATIFDHVPPVVKIVTSPWKSSVKDCTKLVPVTHVCKYWRAVALGASFLWRHISPSFPAQVSVERSRNQPLYICAESEQQEVLHKVMHSGRPIVELEYDGMLDKGTILAYPAPSLRSLTLSSYFGDLSRIEPDRPKLFDGQAPRLEQLSFTDMFCSMPSNTFPALKRLHLSDCIGIQSSDLFSFFSASLGLEHLVMTRIDISIDRGIKSPIHMDHLCTVFITEVSDETVNMILSGISVNEDTVMHLARRDTLTVPQCYPKTNLRRLALWYTHHAVSIMATGSSTGILSTCFHYGRTHEQNYAFHGLRKLPLSQITELWAEALPSTERQTSSINMLLPNLTSLTTLHDNVSGTGYVLKHFIEDQSNPPLCPDLRTVHIRSDDNDDEPLNVGLICKFAERRKLSGCPITRIVINTTERERPWPDHYFKRILKELKKYIREVEFEWGHLPSMAMPALCNNRVHNRWKPWNERWERLREVVFDHDDDGNGDGNGNGDGDGDGDGDSDSDDDEYY